MRIGSWPGYHFDHNPFMKIFLDGLAEAGAEIVSCDSIEDLITADVDAMILQWAETLFWQSPDRWSLLRNIWQFKRYVSKQRSNRPKLVWLAHNLAPHTPRRLQRIVWPAYMRTLSSHVDGVLTLSPGTVDVVRDHFPALTHTPMGFVWHPHYPRSQISRDGARAAVGFTPELQVFGHCGQIRRYKEIDLAMASFEQTKNPKFRLYLAGKPTEQDLAREIEAAARRDPRIITDFRDLTDDDFDAALLCCDTVVAPFRSYLHSGSLVHALSMGRRILTPSTPFADSLANLVGTAHVTTYSGALTPKLFSAEPRQPDSLPDLSAMDPAQVARQVLAFIDTL